METFNEETLSAYFPGLVDVCQDDNGELVYLILKDGDLVTAKEHETEKEVFTIPERQHFPFTIPRASEVMRHYSRDDASLYDDLLSYLKRFSALDDEQWAIVTHYVFLTYLHEHPGIDYCPNILFYAVPERGKSRTGKSIIYVAYRGIHFVELREAVVLRYCKNLHGTIFFDLQDISKKAERVNCNDILLSRYEKGGDCARVQYPDKGPFKDTVHYDTYGPTIIASNESPEKILETRCLPIIMPNRPGYYENPRPKLGLEMKERLTAWRAKHMHVQFEDMNPIEGISGRLWDIAKPLFFMNGLLPVDQGILRDSLMAIDSEKQESRKGSPEGRLVAIIKEITEEDGMDGYVEWSIKVNDIRKRFNEGMPDNRKVSPQWVGKRLKSMSFRNRLINGYSEIRITAGEYGTILRQYGYAGRESGGGSSNSTNSLPENSEQYQEVLRVVESSRECAGDTLEFNSDKERDFFDKKMTALEEEGVASWNDRWALAREALEEKRKKDDVPF